MAAVQIAKGLGARVLAGIVSPEKEAAVRKAGADAVVNLSAPDLHNSPRE